MLRGLFLSALQRRPKKIHAVSVAMGTGLSMLFVLGGLVGTGLAATPTIDGSFRASDGYTNGYSVTFADSAGLPTAGNIGEVWLHQNTATGNVSVALVLPLTLKDNTYGAFSTTYQNKGKAIFQDFDGGGSGLTRSDKAKFVLSDGAGGTTAVNMDFITGFTDSSLSTVNTDDGPFFASGFTGQDNSPSPGSLPAGVLAAATSMGYNFGLFGDVSGNVPAPNGIGDANYPFGTDATSPEIAIDGSGEAVDYVPTDSFFADWDFTHTYEFQVSAAAFGAGFDITSQAAVAAQLLLNEIHISPKKLVADNLVSGEIGGPLSPGGPPSPAPPGSVIPEPSSVTLALTGFIGMLAIGWRRKRKKLSLETAE